jgi:CheY-like chemotaxis protein
MKQQILIVDDELEQLEFASAVLEDEYVTLTAKDGNEGLRIAREQKPDLILLDIMMPEKGGIGMYQDLKRHEGTRDIPVVVVTGVTRGGGFDAHMLTQESELPAPDGYVEKPMNPDELNRVIKTLLS